MPVRSSSFFKILWLASVLALVLPGLGMAQAKTRHRRSGSGQKNVNSQINSDFLSAIQTGDIAAFYSLLKRGANVNASNETRTNALMRAALNGQTTFVAVLISKGARVNAQNVFGNTALMDASGFGQVEMVKWLLIARANVIAKNRNGWTALMFASKSAYAKQPNFQEVVALLKAAEDNRRKAK